MSKEVLCHLEGVNFKMLMFGLKVPCTSRWKKTSSCEGHFQNIFWLVLKLEKFSYRVIISLEGFWFLFRGCFEDYIFAR
jgi:hypothetical protein